MSIEGKIKELRESRDYYKKAYEELQEKNRDEIRKEDQEEKKSTIKIGGYGGIEIPLDKEIKKAISNFVYAQVRSLIEEDQELQKNFFQACLNYKRYFKELFSPLIRDAIEDMDFSVNFESERD